MTVRITHWLNALAIVIMIMSGWRIYNSDPIFPFYFPVDLTLGGIRRLGGPSQRGRPCRCSGTLPACGCSRSTASSISPTGSCRPFPPQLFPVGQGAFLRDTVAALKFQLPHQLGVYNAVQKTLYLGVLAAGVIMVLSGLAIWKPGQFQELTWLFGGFGVARVIHFLGMVAIVLFLIVHVALVIIVPKTLPTMISGRAPAHETPAHAADGEG